MAKQTKKAEVVSGYRVEAVAIEDLRAYSRNSRKHSRDQVEQIVASIRQYGWTNPMLVDLGADHTIVAGHGRLEAAKLIYAAGESISLPDGRQLPPGTVPVIDCSGWSEKQRRAYVIADNRIAENASWDEGLLKIELGDILKDSDESPDDLALGFSQADIEAMFAEALANDPGKEWKGMPEFDQADKTAFRTIPVHFANQQAVDEFAALIKQKITEKTRFVWFPEIEIERYADKRYAAEEK